MKRSAYGALIALLALAGCAKDKPAPQKARTEREKDSVLAQSSIPGHAGVASAMRVADSAGNHVHLQDSIANSGSPQE